MNLLKTSLYCRKLLNIVFIYLLSITFNTNLYALPIESYCISKQEIKKEKEPVYSVKKPLSINSIIKLPDLKDKPCSFLASIWGSCEKAPVIYSGNLNRFFMTGYNVTPFGTSSPYGIEVVNSQIKPLPEQLHGAELVGDIYEYVINAVNRKDIYNYYQDIPHLNGVLFRGYNGDAIFYNGQLAYSLLNNYLKKSVNNLDIDNRWNANIAPISKRVFLNKLPCYYRPPWLMELKFNGGLIPIDRPDSLIEYSLHEFREDLQLFAVGRRTVAAEVREETHTDMNGIVSSALRTVVIIPEPSYINGGYDGYSNNAIRLLIHNPESKADTNYFIVRKTPSIKCFATLNPKKPVVIYDE